MSSALYLKIAGGRYIKISKFAVKIICMENTANKICRCIVSLLEKHGVKQAVVSPGSRNAPLLIALSRNDAIRIRVVIDERSAGFIALGMSVTLNEPVALVCTSGTALLNYAPAIAEAFYRKVPLIVISADRPKEWIGQDDSQTILQPGALSNFVKRCYDIEADDSDKNLWYANRVTNDAMISAMSGRIGPVHLNIRLSEPLGTLSDDAPDSESHMLNREIRIIKPKSEMSEVELSDLGSCLVPPCKVMIIAGFLQPDKNINKALVSLSQKPNIIVLTETIANLHGDYFVSCIDATLSAIRADMIDEMRPDIVISTGGALVSRHIKQFLRSASLKAHWHVGEMEDTVDCFCRLTMRIEMNPAVFFTQLASAIPNMAEECDYARIWDVARCRALALTTSYSQRAIWSDMKAFATLIPMIPLKWNVHFSNGTAIRYAQIFGNHKYHRCDCNRGVSGIDGSTSTAIGASIVYERDTTLLISGDMSAQYDLSALTCRYISPRFKMIVINNHGGGIFRFIPSTSGLDIREEMFCCGSDLSLAEIGAACGFCIFEASDEDSLRREFRLFASESTNPAMLVINTPADLSASVLKEYFEFCKRH